ncbi:MAG: ABC1 kinase family protein, partial [Pseudomonadales bacterium]
MAEQRKTKTSKSPARSNAGEAKVPTGRLSRLARVAGLAGGVAGGMLAEGVRQLRAGDGLNASDMLLTPANAKRVADQLASMRGAAMKLGQILSMDTGDLLPKELTDTLSRLRADAQAMPMQQLEAQLESVYGDDWQELLYGFDYQPLAAASIGQVHRSFSPDGKHIVLKIQYPGIAKSIDSDIDNIATVLRVSGLLPKGFDIKPLLNDAKKQLHDEANYLLEASYQHAYQKHLADDDRFIVPQIFDELSSETILVMGYVDGEPIETLIDYPQAERDRVMTALVDLMFTELFDWHA